MGSIVRLFVGTPLAIIVTVALFLFMYFLISGTDLELNEDAETVRIEIGRQIEDTPEQATQKQFERPQLDQPPPPPPAINDANFRPEVAGVRAGAPSFDANVDIGTGFNPDRDAQPLVRIEPQYPDRCQGRSGDIETVVVEFDVDPAGQTVNARVVRSTNSCFDRNVLRAVERWKYQPKIVDGQAEPRYGVRTTFKFQIQG